MECVYDFSKPRVRCNGRAMDKFAVAYAIDMYRPWSLATIRMDVLSYADLKNELQKVVEEKL